jgi:hypothetical protein
VAIEKFDDHIQRIAGLRNIHVVEESMKEAFPNMELGVDTHFDQLLVRVKRGTHLEAACSGND